MRQGSWSRPLQILVFLNRKLEWMDRNHINHCVVLNLSQLYCNGMEQNLSRDVIRFQNDFNASLQSDRPKQFTGGFVVQPNYLDDALKEIERCVNQLNLKYFVYQPISCTKGSSGRA